MAAYHHTFHRGIRKLPTLVYAPTATGTFPVVVFGHGLTGEPAEYAVLLRDWSSAGFVVAAPAFPDTSGASADFSIFDVPNQPADLGAACSPG